MNPRRAAITATAAAGIALLAGACGGGQPAATGTTVYQKALAYAQCMRAHGEPGFPDPDGQRAFDQTLANDAVPVRAPDLPQPHGIREGRVRGAVAAGPQAGKEPGGRRRAGARWGRGRDGGGRRGGSRGRRRVSGSPVVLLYGATEALWSI